MMRIDEHISSAMMSRDFSKGLPFYGTKGDFSFTAGRSQFTPGISIKQTPLTDLSVKGDSGFSQLDMAISKLRMYFKPGNRIRGKVVNSLIHSENGKIAVGNLAKIEPNYSTNEIRCWIRNPKTGEMTEVYVDSIERIYESSSTKALNFSQFINS
ncbi:hypothetical protein UFOVP699_79 [uncultured Caudovirales phage]|uniref:Uncharacterized protein n=1 Tax=uncultured Caudovirales phage TaxID=2100421 RepID=A0A6J5NQG2_9CAUD|nr:hypothetical protein UFOVP699_79 [uncultured Caudovirales phage]